jgi:HSP20 family molecular chaperone IbpA
MTTLASHRTEVPITARPPMPYLFSWLDSLWPGDLDLMVRAGHGIRIEEFTRNGDFVVRAELPGIDVEKDLEVTVDHGVLTIEASREERTESDQRSEFAYGSFRRSVMLPGTVDESAVSAAYSDGILEVTVAMAKEPAQRRVIPIAHGG